MPLCAEYNMNDMTIRNKELQIVIWRGTRTTKEVVSLLHEIADQVSKDAIEEISTDDMSVREI